MCICIVYMPYSIYSSTCSIKILKKGNLNTNRKLKHVKNFFNPNGDENLRFVPKGPVRPTFYIKISDGLCSITKESSVLLMCLYK